MVPLRRGAVVDCHTAACVLKSILSPTMKAINSLKSPISAGRVPVKELIYRDRYLKFVSCPISGGIVEVSLSRKKRDIALSYILTVKARAYYSIQYTHLLSAMLRYCSSGKFPTEDGILPLKLRAVKSICTMKQVPSATQ